MHKSLSTLSKHEIIYQLYFCLHFRATWYANKGIKKGGKTVKHRSGVERRRTFLYRIYFLLVTIALDGDSHHRRRRHRRQAAARKYEARIMLIMITARWYGTVESVHRRNQFIGTIIRLPLFQIEGFTSTKKVICCCLLVAAPAADFVFLSPDFDALLERKLLVMSERLQNLIGFYSIKNKKLGSPLSSS